MISLQPFRPTDRQVFRLSLVGERSTQRFTANSARMWLRPGRGDVERFTRHYTDVLASPRAVTTPSVIGFSTLRATFAPTLRSFALLFVLAQEVTLSICLEF